MTQLQTKWIADDAVNDTKIKLRSNQPLRARNAADDADVELFRLDASNDLILKAGAKIGADLIATEDYVDTAVGALAGAFVYKGEYDAATNAPALSDATGTVGWIYRVSTAGTQDFGSGDITFQVGDKAVYREGVWAKWDVIDNEFATSDTDDLAEGTTNLYHTDARAQTAAVVDSTEGNETEMAPSVSAMKSYAVAKTGDTMTGDLNLTDSKMVATSASGFYSRIQGGAIFVLDPTDSVGVDITSDSIGISSTVTNLDIRANISDGLIECWNTVSTLPTMPTLDRHLVVKQYVDDQIATVQQDFGSQVITLSAQNITDGYVDLAHDPIEASLHVFVSGGLPLEPVADYEIDAVVLNRLNFLGNLAALAAANDKLVVKYAY